MVTKMLSSEQKVGYNPACVGDKCKFFLQKKPRFFAKNLGVFEVSKFNAGTQIYHGKNIKVAITELV